MLPTLIAALVAAVSVAAALWYRGRAAEAVRVAEERVETLLHYAPEAIVILAPETGRFVEVNAQAEKLFGRSREELLTLGPPDVSPETLPTGENAGEAAAKKIQEAAQGGSPVFEWWHERPDGTLVPCDVRLVRLPSVDRTLIRGSVIDATDRRAAEEERQVLEEQLRQSRKLEAVGQLTGGVAHDFNNILTVAMGNLELLIDDLPTGEENRGLAEEALESLGRAALLTSQLLAFSRRQPLRPEPVDVGELVLGMTTLLRRTLGEAVDVRETIDDDLWRTDTDRTQLETAILNLALNARDAMRGKGILGIEVCNLSVDPDVIESWYAQHSNEWDPGVVPASRDFVRLSVTDFGVGMDEATAARAFDPFFTTKDVGKGSGLGLSMIYGFAVQSGGHVEIESERGIGTTVRLFLPRSAHVAPEVADLDETVEDGLQHTREGTVLMVEDDPGVRGVGSTFIEHLGYDCVPVEDAYAALAYLSEGPRVDVLFTDIVLPGGMSGLELAREVRKRYPDLRVVFASGYSEDMVDELAGAREVGPLVSKPYSRQDLARIL